MIRKNIWLGMLAILFIIGFTLTGCDENFGNSGLADPIVGRWVISEDGIDVNLGIRRNGNISFTARMNAEMHLDLIQGDGRCWDCNGTGYDSEECWDCNGTGFYGGVCWSCAGEGEIIYGECWSCDGTGESDSSFPFDLSHFINVKELTLEIRGSYYAAADAIYISPTGLRSNAFGIVISALRSLLSGSLNDSIYDLLLDMGLDSDPIEAILGELEGILNIIDINGILNMLDNDLNRGWIGEQQLKNILGYAINLIKKISSEFDMPEREEVEGEEGIGGIDEILDRLQEMHDNVFEMISDIPIEYDLNGDELTIFGLEFTRR
jgi:hypothetical protein